MIDEVRGKLRLAVAAIVAGAALASALAGAAEVATVSRPLVIQRIDLGGAEPLARIDVALDGAPAWTTMRSPEGHVVVELAYTRAGTGVVTRLYPVGLVSGVRISAVGVPSRPVTRLVVETRGAVEVRFDAAGSRLGIDLAPKGIGFPQPAVAPAPRPAPPPAPAPVPAAPPPLPTLAPAAVPPVDAALASPRGETGLAPITIPSPPKPAARMTGALTPPQANPIAAIEPEIAPVERRPLASLPAPAPVASRAQVLGVPTPPEPEPVAGLESVTSPEAARLGEIALAPPPPSVAQLTAVPTPPEPEAATPAVDEEDLSAPKLAAQPAPARPVAPATSEPGSATGSTFAPRGSSEAPPEPLPQVTTAPPAAASAAAAEPHKENATPAWLPFVDAGLEPAIDAPKVEPAAPPELATAPGEAVAPHPEATVARRRRIEEEDLGEPLAASAPADGPAPLASPSPPVTGTADHPWIAPPPSAPAARELTAIEHPEPGLVRVLGDGAFAYATFRLAEPDRFVIDLDGVVSRAPRTLLKIEEGVVLRVRISQFHSLPNPVARVIFDLSAPAIPTIERSGSSLVVRFR